VAAARRGSSDPWLDWMVLPTLGVLAIVVGYPIVYTAVLSGAQFNLLDPAPARFVGAANYAKLWSDGIFWQALRNTAVYTFGSVAVSVVIGLCLALLVESYAGPRMLWQHPILSVRHWLDGFRKAPAVTT
jgi:ABC-type sugar transport system permease subunit